MGAGHSHAPATGHAGGRYRRRLAGAFALTAGFFLIELVAGLVSGSLALLSDAGHMAADVVVLGAALLATRIASRPDSTGRRTYGSYRAEVFASALAVLAMLAVGVYVVVEAISRLGDAPEVASGAMLAVGFAGLVINIISMLLLRSGAKDSLNVKGAYYEVIADAARSHTHSSPASSNAYSTRARRGSPRSLNSPANLPASRSSGILSRVSATFSGWTAVT